MKYYHNGFCKVNEVGTINQNDTVKIIKGHKTFINSIAKVIVKRSFYDQNGNFKATYLYLNNGIKINIDNCILA